MSASPSRMSSRPPRLSMDEYADFVEASLRDAKPVHVARQKELEKRIKSPFRMAEPTKAAAAEQPRR